MKNRRNRNFLNDFDSIFNSFFGGITPGGYFGQSNTEEGMDENGKWVKQTFKSDDGSVMMTSFYRESGEGQPKNKLETLKHEVIKCIEIDDFEKAKSKKDRMGVIQQNLSQTLVKVLELTFHPQILWKVKELPDNYKIPTDMLPGLTYDSLNAQLRRLYMFREGDPTAESLTPRRREELLLQILESIEPREAEVILGIFQKDLGVKGLDYKFVKEAFPNLLP